MHVVPGHAAAVRARIAEMPGAVVHAEDGGRLAATLEGPRSGAIAEALNTIQRMTGVVSAVLVSEHSEPMASLDEEIPHGE